jgi:hypothetical protein
LYKKNEDSVIQKVVNLEKEEELTVKEQLTETLKVINYLVIILDSSGKWDKQKKVISSITDYMLLLVYH